MIYIENWFCINGYDKYIETITEIPSSPYICIIHFGDLSSLSVENAIRSDLIRDGFAILKIIRDHGALLYIIQLPAKSSPYLTKAEAMNALVGIANGGLWQLYKQAPADTRSIVTQRLATYILEN